MRSAITTFAMWLLWSAIGAAQGAAPSPTAGFQDGFFVQSADGDHRLVFGVLIQTDGRFSTDDPTPIVNTFTMRRIRPTLSGRVAKYFDFKLTPEFGSGTTTVVDANFDIRFSPKLRLRIGKDKTPVGYELLISDQFLLFPERSLASNLVPNRDVGVQAQGDLTPWLYYAGGVVNGVADGASSTSDVDTNNGKDLAGRVVVRGPGGLGFQLGGSTGTHEGALPVFRTSVGQTYFSYATGATAAGTQTRVTPAAFYYRGPAVLYAEYMRSTQEASRLEEAREFTNQGWNVAAGYLLTGETAGTSYTRPRKPFDPAAGTWGALQIVARYAEVDFDDDIAASGFGVAGSADHATQFTVGLNWYATPYVKTYLTFEHTDFDGGTPPARPTEHVILFRFQLGI